MGYLGTLRKSAINGKLKLQFQLFQQFRTFTLSLQTVKYKSFVRLSKVQESANTLNLFLGECKLSEERITEEELKKLQHLIFLCRSKAAQFISLIPTQQDANKALLDYLKELAKKYNCDYKDIMTDGTIVRK